jgi:Tfp pilus assembly protein PilE
MWIKMLFNKRGVILITLLIWVIIIVVIIIYAPRLYNWYVEQNEIKIIKSNVESVEKEILRKIGGVNSGKGKSKVVSDIS